MTVLTDEVYTAYDPREDRAFYNLIVAIHARLQSNLIVRHPVANENLTKTSSDPEMTEFRERLEWAINRLAVTLDPDCTKKSALKAWADVFDTSYFEHLTEDKSASKLPFAVTRSTPTKPVDKRGGGRFGQ